MPQSRRCKRWEKRVVSDDGRRGKANGGGRKCLLTLGLVGRHRNKERAREQGGHTPPLTNRKRTDWGPGFFLGLDQSKYVY